MTVTTKQLLIAMTMRLGSYADAIRFAEWWNTLSDLSEPDRRLLASSWIAVNDMQTGDNGTEAATIRRALARLRDELKGKP